MRIQCLFFFFGMVERTFIFFYFFFIQKTKKNMKKITTICVLPRLPSFSRVSHRPLCDPLG